MRRIDADSLGARMYYEAFEKDSEDQRWDSGCWIRYRLFEKVLKEAPTVEPEQKTGKWVHGRELSREMIGDCIIAIRYDGWKCSECDCLVEEEHEPLYKFCPNCGAKMEVEDD